MAGSDEGISYRTQNYRNPVALAFSKFKIKASFRLHPDASAGTSMPMPRMGATAFCLMAPGHDR